MTRLQLTPIEKVFARLPLFDGLSASAIARLSLAGLGRGLLTSTLRARLRRAGFVDMGTLALATPDELASVRKIGPVRIVAIRAHIVNELARFDPGARAQHSDEATAGRRIDRLRAALAERTTLDGEILANLDRADAASAIRPQDLEPLVETLARLLLAAQPYPRFPTSMQSDEAAEREAQAPERAELLRQRDREWEEAAPVRPREVSTAG